MACYNIFIGKQYIEDYLNKRFFYLLDFNHLSNIIYHHESCSILPEYINAADVKWLTYTSFDLTRDKKNFMNLTGT